MTILRHTIEQQYLFTLADLLEDSPRQTNRTGVDTWEQPGITLKADLSAGFPVLTTKRVMFNHVVSELLWFIRGDTNIKYLHKHDNHIWDEWADENGDLGPVYGAQWRKFGAASYGAMRSVARRALAFGAPSLIAEADALPPSHVDQLANAIDKLKNKPDDRRIIVSAWNPLEISMMRLPPCHLLFQFLVSGGKLHTIVYQRSADWFLGVPFNIASYALLTHIVGWEIGLAPGSLTMMFGSAHLYVNHEAQAREQLKRTPRHTPVLMCNPQPWDQYDPTDLWLESYDPHPFIKAAVAV